MNALYAPLIERDLDGFTAAAKAFLASRPVDELWTAVARFAVLAYSPSQHSKRAVMAVRAAYEIHESMGDRFAELVLACARYAAESRPPWSEPPILDPPAVDPEDELRDANVTGDALLMLDTARVLIPLLGEKGRYALLRMPLLELHADPGENPAAPLDVLVARAIEARGSIESVTAVFTALAVQPAQRSTPDQRSTPTEPSFAPYPLARDFAQTLIAHAFVRRFPPDADAQGFLAAVHENLEHGESYADWSFA